MVNSQFNFIPHAADIQLQITASSAQELFQHALRGMFFVMRPKGRVVSLEKNSVTCAAYSSERHISLTSKNETFLLIEFLAEALYLFESFHEIYTEVVFEQLEATALEATLRGCAISGCASAGIKAVTYHDAFVRKEGSLWRAQIVFDI